MSYTRNWKITLSILIIDLATSVILLLQPLRAQAKEIRFQESIYRSTLTSPSRVQEASTGLISGKLSFPSERIPTLTIFAMRIDNGENTYYSIQTEEHQSSYSIRVDPGVYQVLAYVDDFAGGYTRYVQCGLGFQCQDHSLVPVVVQAGEIVTGIDLQDWYAPSGSFPLRPDWVTTFEPTVTCSGYHTVKPGENLFRIGLIYNMTWIPIAKANDIPDPNVIYSGQVLCIPSSTKTITWKPARTAIPTFEIVGVVKDKQVTIKTYDFPADTDFVVTMGRMGTQGINGKEIARTNSGKGGSLTATFSIPAKFHGEQQIAIRLQSTSGYYSYNWFYNNSTK
jgi:hypothetical protein